MFGLPILEYVRDFTFAYVTPLEFFYPMVAGCEQGGLNIYQEYQNIWNMLVQTFGSQILINIVRFFGTIGYSTMSFTDCWYLLDGKCAGKKLGKLQAYLLMWQDIYDPSKLSTYNTKLISLQEAGYNVTN